MNPQPLEPGRPTPPLRLQVLRKGVEMLAQVRGRFAVVGHDLLMVAGAWLAAFWLRYNLEPMAWAELAPALETLPVVLGVHALVFLFFGLYRGIWRFASIPDLILIGRSVALGVLLSAILVFFLNRMEGVPRAVFPIFGLLLFFGLGGPRFIWRRLFEGSRAGIRSEGVLIVGAGAAGEALARNIIRDNNTPYYPQAFVDDDPAKRGKAIHGVRVLGTCDDIPAVVAKSNISLIVLALPMATSEQMRRIFAICSKVPVPTRTLPPINNLLSGDVTLQQLREISIDDLLGREPVELDWQAIRAGIAGKVVLVTGGGGSIGAELCRQVARVEPAALVVLDASEYNLYAIELELRERYPALALEVRLGNVCDAALVERLMKAVRPEVVFHAAAYKHVPLLQSNLREAVRNNVVGTRVVADAAHRHGVGHFTLVSTDKAVNPTNVMGASKRIAEIYCQNLNRFSDTRFITVRFGNVLGSSGSVVPLFRKQIEAGGPVTVTHPDMQRYFMTIPEACQLILNATVAGQGGEIFVLEMGEPVKISFLAEQLILLSGKVPGRDIQIVYTGLRPGEKIHEELFHEKERLVKTGSKKILMARYREADWDALQKKVGALESACAASDEARLRNLLMELVPEYAAEQTGAEPGAAPPRDAASG